MKSTAIRVDEQVFNIISDFAEKEKLSKGQVVEVLLKSYQQKPKEIDIEKRFDQVFAFIKKQEQTLLLPIYEKVVLQTKPEENKQEVRIERVDTYKKIIVEWLTIRVKGFKLSGGEKDHERSIKEGLATIDKDFLTLYNEIKRLQGI